MLYIIKINQNFIKFWITATIAKMPATTKKPEQVEERITSPVFSKGAYIFPNGDKYNGDFVHLPEGGLLRQGKGEHIGNDGLRYEGDWQDDKMHGKGKMTCASGAVYEGDFDMNCFHGYGKYTWPDGSYFEGTFRENKMTGEGRFTDVNNQVWLGDFARNSAVGLKFKLNM